MLETCPSCECELTESCCGEVDPYERDGRQYCCRGCAVDGECACGCTRVESATEPSDGEAAEEPVTPLL